MAIATNLGYPRIGPDRQLKRALEAHWAGKISAEELQATAAQIRRDNWLLQKQVGLDHIPSNDFSLYDHVLDTAAMLSAVPERFKPSRETVELETYFAMARGRTGPDGAAAMAMKKWFDTNYHYIAPELNSRMPIVLGSEKPVAEFEQAQGLGVSTRPVLLGPVTFLLLSKSMENGFDPLALLPAVLTQYAGILRKLADAGARWVQIDEPALVGDLSVEAREAYSAAMAELTGADDRLRVLLTTYFGPLRENWGMIKELPVHGIHLDLTRAPEELDDLLAAAGPEKFVSLGVVDGRNIWRTNLAEAFKPIRKAIDTVGSERVMIAPSCSLLHSPVDLDTETRLDAELKGWMAFARQKLTEIALLARAANEGVEAVADEWNLNADAMKRRSESTRIHSPAVGDRLKAVTPEMYDRKSPYPARRGLQAEALKLPPLPTTTIGSFPQTKEVRAARAANRKGEMTDAEYETFLKEQIADCITRQEEIDLDVLVHGEFERTDMVEYFGQQLSGFAHTGNGWVQSYGSRCVKPPIIFGDVARPEPMTVDWTRYAAGLTDRPVKGMLTGPVTILQWSFVRDDQPRSETCRQIALTIRDEVVDLEAAGIGVIQIDEPALREGLPLRRQQWADYLKWAVECFRLSAAGVEDRTQIHTHMCYSEFNDIIESIAALDADVISIEASRSKMELLKAFEQFEYPNEIGPGVYDIHSPRVPSEEEMVELLHEALKRLSAGQLWVNPDCGLKTRQWEQVTPALEAMVAAAKTVRQELESNG